MYPRLLIYLLLSLITVPECSSGPHYLNEEQRCERAVSKAIQASLEMSSMTCKVPPKVSQPNTRQLLDYVKMDYQVPDFRPNDLFKPNVTCPTSFPVNVSVKLTAENGTVHCSIQDPEELALKCGYLLKFYYDDKWIVESEFGINRRRPYWMANSENIGTYSLSSVMNYPDFSMTLRKSSTNRGLESTTVNGVYQCSIHTANRLFDSNAIYYHWEDSSPVISSKKMDRSLIGGHLKCDLDYYSETGGCTQNAFNRLRPMINLIPNTMKITEVRHPWNSNDSKINYTLKYYQTGIETVYEAKCSIKDDLRVNINDNIPSTYAERVCFGVNDMYIGCYLRWSNWNHSVWNQADKIKSSYRIKDYKNSQSNKFYRRPEEFRSDILVSTSRIEHSESGEVFKVFMKNLSEEDRRFYCVKTIIFGTLLSEHSFESNYLTKPEAELLPGSTPEMMFEPVFEPDTKKWMPKKDKSNRQRLGFRKKFKPIKTFGNPNGFP